MKKTKTDRTQPLLAESGNPESSVGCRIHGNDFSCLRIPVQFQEW